MYLPSKFRSKYVRVAALAILIALPFKDVVESVFILFSRQLVFNPPKISQTINDLKKNDAALLLKIRELEYLKIENATLKQALQFKTEHNVTLVGAQVIAFDPSSWRRIVILDSGKTHNMKSGQFVIDERGWLLGRIVETGDNYSKLMLLDDPAFKLPVFIGEHSLGLLRGGLGGVQILYLENTEQIKEKDKIWCKIPLVGLPIFIGEVREIKKQRDSLFLDIDVKLFSQSPLVRTVFVMQ